MPARRILNWKIFGWSFTSKKLHREWSYTCQTNDQLVSKKHTHTHTFHCFFRPVAKPNINLPLVCPVESFQLPCMLLSILYFQQLIWRVCVFSFYISIGERDFSWIYLWKKSLEFFRITWTEQQKRMIYSELHSTVFSHFCSDSMNYMICLKWEIWEWFSKCFRSDQPFQ